MPQHVWFAKQRRRGPHSSLPSLQVSTVFTHRPPAQQVSSLAQDCPPHVKHWDVAAMQRAPKVPEQHCSSAEQTAPPQRGLTGVADGLGLGLADGVGKGDGAGHAFANVGGERVVESTRDWHTPWQHICSPLHLVRGGTAPPASGSPAQAVAKQAYSADTHRPSQHACVLLHVAVPHRGALEGVGAGDGVGVGDAGHTLMKLTVPLAVCIFGTQKPPQHSCNPVHMTVIPYPLDGLHDVPMHTSVFGTQRNSQHCWSAPHAVSPHSPGAVGQVVDHAPAESCVSGTQLVRQHICIPVHVATVNNEDTHGVVTHANPVGMQVPAQHVPEQTAPPQRFGVGVGVAVGVGVGEGHAVANEIAPVLST